MKTPHKHAALIKAWADGAEIEYKHYTGVWKPCGTSVGWLVDFEYRIKPKLKPDMMTYYYVNGDNELFRWSPLNRGNADLRVIVDGETGKLKSAEVL